MQPLSPGYRQAFDAIVNVLREQRGEKNGVTIDQLTRRAGLPGRRQTEQLLELHLDKFPFAVCSASSGYFRPQTPDELTHYWNSLHSRLCCLARRLGTVRKLALQDGYRFEGKRFHQRTAQSELFATFPGTACAEKPGMDQRCSYHLQPTGADNVGHPCGSPPAKDSGRPEG